MSFIIFYLLKFFWIWFDCILLLYLTFFNFFNYYQVEIGIENKFFLKFIELQDLIYKSSKFNIYQVKNWKWHGQKYIINFPNYLHNAIAQIKFFSNDSIQQLKCVGDSSQTDTGWEGVFWDTNGISNVVHFHCWITFCDSSNYHNNWLIVVDFSCEFGHVNQLGLGWKGYFRSIWWQV